MCMYLCIRLTESSSLVTCSICRGNMKREYPLNFYLSTRWPRIFLLHKLQIWLMSSVQSYKARNKRKRIIYLRAHCSPNMHPSKVLISFCAWIIRTAEDFQRRNFMNKGIMVFAAMSWWCRKLLWLKFGPSASS